MKLLFIRFSSLGDVLLTTGVLKTFSENFPGAELHVLTYDEFAPVLSRLPYISRVYSVPRKIPLRRYMQYLKTLPPFTHIIDWHGNLRSRLGAAALRGKVHRYDKQSLCRRLYVKFRFCGRKLAVHTVIRYAQALFPLFNLPVPPLESLRPWLPNDAPEVPNKAVVHPFASQYTKTWPYFTELVRYLLQEGWQVYIVGKGDFPEQEGAYRINTPALEDLFFQMRDAALVISTDSGPMHAAVALGRPLIAIFGSTTRELGFYPYFSGCAVVENETLSCRPCHVHGLPECPLKHFKCMKDLPLNKVIEQIKVLKS